MGDGGALSGASLRSSELLGAGEWRGAGTTQGRASLGLGGRPDEERAQESSDGLPEKDAALQITPEPHVTRLSCVVLSPEHTA